MMKLISLKCPSCGAKLEVNGDLDKYTCNFCGVTTLLDDESITVKHVGSKLQTEINTVKDYYDNGNYKKALSLSEALLNEYPTNKELKKLYDNSELIIAESFAKEVLENEYKVKTVKG